MNEELDALGVSVRNAEKQNQIIQSYGHTDYHRSHHCCSNTILVELFVIPGISLAGISALACILYANYYAFANLGMAGGFITLGISAVACIGSLIWFMRSKMLDKLALKKILTRK